MNWYGLHGMAPTQGYPCDRHWVVAGGDTTLLDGKPLMPPVRTLRGAVSVDGVLYIASVDSLVLLKPDGTHIDTFNSLPITSIRRIGTVGNRIAIENHNAFASVDGEHWQTIAPGEVRWSQPENLPAPVRAATAAHLQPSLPLARVVADAHSGRLFGRYGPLLIDATGLAAILLAASGVWMALRDARRRRQVRHSR